MLALGPGEERQDRFEGVALAAVRQYYWTPVGFRVSARRNDKLKLPKALRESLTYALCRAARWVKSS